MHTDLTAGLSKHRLAIIDVQKSGKVMKLIIMTKPTFFVEEDKILATLFDEGMEVLHLYKPNSSPLYSERLLSLLPEDSYRKIIVHDHFYLKEEYRLAGIHLDSNTIKCPNGYKGHIGRTCRNLSELKEMKRNSNYVFLANIFPTEAAPIPSFTKEELEEASRQGLIDKKVMALGGVTADNVRQVRDLGFGGAVVCSDLWTKFDIHNGCDFAELIAHFDRLRKNIG